MFYTIGLLVAFSVILLIFDHKSRYSYLFVLMATGATLAFFSIILHINMFASYGEYYGGSIYYRLDYMIYKVITARLALPIVMNIRLMNVGIALFLLAETIFNYEFQKNLGRGEPKTEKKNRRMRPRSGARFRHAGLFILVPLLSLILYDPVTSTKMYILYHISGNKPLVYALFCFINVVFKLVVLLLLLRPICVLIRYVMVTSVRFLRKRILLFSMGLLLADAIFYVFFYIGPFSVSVDKVIRSGFWIFENVQARIQKVYLTAPSLVLVVISFCMFILLSFRMDMSATPFVKRKIQKNLNIMNEVLGETLHSQKNLFFSQQILITKIENKVEDKEAIPEIGRMRKLIDESLGRTTQVLDELKEIKYHYLNNSVTSIIDEALNEVTLPSYITVEWNSEGYEDICGMYDRYHLCKALVNILNNSVEAIEQSGKEEGKITIRLEFLFRWLIIMIQDNGKGIRFRDRGRVFSPHYSGKQGKMNWGLGLPYVYKVIRAHLGQIKIDSRYGVYTSVFLLLPMSREEKAGPALHNAVPVPPKALAPGDTK